MMSLSVAEYHALLRNDFHTFMHGAFLELNPQVKFLPNWHNELIASKLEACRRGEINRLIINVPPRSLKSHAATVAFPAFIHGHHPNAQIMCASYGQDLANKHALDSRALINSLWYQRLFPTRISPHKQAVQEFMTTQNGFRLATSVGGVLTGRGADFIIIDDAMKPEEAFSESQRKNVNDWFDHTLYSRLNNKRKGCIIIIMQRLHQDDLVGHVLEQESWEHVRLPAIAEVDETHMIQSRYHRHVVHRKAGEALHPEREPLEVLDKMRQTMGEYNFSGQYQQSPSPLGGGLVKAIWLRYYVPGEQPAHFDLTFQSWDTANKPTELSDYSVCTTWGLKNRDLYLLHVLRDRLEYPQLKRAVQAQADRFQPSNILIEDKASGTQLIQELRQDGICEVTPYEPGGLEKTMRLHSVTSTFENGLVYLPTEAPWLKAYVHELTSFPAGKYDDQTDSTSQALIWVKEGTHRYGLWEYFREQAAKATPSQLPEEEDIFSSNILPVCPKCQQGGPAQRRHTYHCYPCGYEWKDVRYWREHKEIPRYTLSSGATAVWDAGRQFWVNTTTGETHTPAKPLSA